MRVSTDPLLTEREAAPQLSRSEAALRDWRYRGGGPKYVKLGGKIRYRQSDIDAYIAANTHTPTDHRARVSA